MFQWSRYHEIQRFTEGIDCSLECSTASEFVKTYKMMDVKHVMKIFPIMICLSLLFFLPGCGSHATNAGPVEVTGKRYIMHTDIQIKIIDKNPREAEKTMEGAFRIFSDYEKKYSFFNKDSLLNSINRNGGISGVMPPELIKMLEASFDVSEKSGGAFDITVGPLVRLWNFSSRNPEIPSQEQIKRILPLVGYKRITLKNGRLSLKPGTLIDLGGVAKGFAVDDASEYLKQKGICRFMVNGGGNISVMGKNTNNKLWRIGIMDPRAPQEIIGYLDLDNESVSTSGDYQRFFMKNGKRYHHILDPHTGYPAYGCTGVTVVSQSAGLADILSKTFVLGTEKGMRLLAEMGCEGVFITESKITVTRGISKRVDITSKKYKVINP